MIRIFLAHASEDKEAVTHLYQHLKESGFKPWLDKFDLLPGQSWRAEIPKAIRNSHVFIACLSRQSVKKQGYIQREFRMALNIMADRPPDQIYLIPARLDDCQIPELRQEEYGISLTDYQWVNLFEADGYERLVQAINAGFTDMLAQTEEPQTGITDSRDDFSYERQVNSSSYRLSHSVNQQLLQAFSFEMITVDRKGNINHREERTVKSYREELGDGTYLDLVKIPGGSFWMGSPVNEPGRANWEGPQHRVQVPTFYMILFSSDSKSMENSIITR